LDPLLILAIVSFALVGGILVICALVEAFELSELLTAGAAQSKAGPPALTRSPFVSFHVPICSEPPDVVEKTLRAFNGLHYDAFEVLVIDNNTKDQSLWRPIEALCRELGPKFRFFHLESWSGFKAGALNYALRQTAPAASLIGVIDADYETAPEFLAEVVGYFQDEQIAFVQTPQDYRDWSPKPFSRMCYWEYWQVFAVSMKVRSRRNAILMHGTMSLVRKDAVLQAGGWAEWCLTEDSELGLRLLSNRLRSVYVTKTYGRGLVPFTYGDYKRQRRRWVIGGVQQLKHHARVFLPWRGGASQMNFFQKIHYLRGWLLWFRDAVIVSSLLLSALGAMAIVAGWLPPWALIPVAIGLTSVIVQLILRQVIVYLLYLSVNWQDAFGAMVANCSLTWTIGCAWIVGSITSDQTFQRTPKRAHAESSWFGTARAETLIGGGMLMLALVVAAQSGLSAWGAIVALLGYALLLLPAPFMAWRSARDLTMPVQAGPMRASASQLTGCKSRDSWIK
jgi:cellulose synthase/poly-beta-1,6-N-acetylglucosamine synthase-like glycosyltransferase